MASLPTSRFVSVQVEPCDAAENGLTLRFKAAGEARRVMCVSYESETGVTGKWRVVAVSRNAPNAEAVAIPVEDSSDGTVLLVTGGTEGLRLEHELTGVVVREPYLILSMATELDWVCAEKRLAHDEG